jgi:flagellar hook-length control protein FliK
MDASAAMPPGAVASADTAMTPTPLSATQGIAPNTEPERTSRAPEGRTQPPAAEARGLQSAAPPAATATAFAANGPGGQLAGPGPFATAAPAGEADTDAALAAALSADMGPRTGPAGPPPAALPEGPRPANLPQHLAAQVLQVTRSTSGAPIELSLNPAELGRLRISMTPAETGLHVVLQAERADTMDLLRRHADLLTQEFRAAGYERISFAFSDGAGFSASRDGAAQPLPRDLPAGRGDAPPGPEGTPAAPVAAGLAIRLTDTLDIRL